VNAIGWRTLFAKETRRFLKVPGQTLAQPVVTTALYFLVFGFAVGRRIGPLDASGTHGAVPYVRFIVPGLIMLGLIQNSFLNSASSMFIMKLQGTIVDLLVAPLSTADILTAFVLAAVVRGVAVGAITWLVAGLFTDFHIAHPLWMLTFALLVGTTFGLLGLAVAIWSQKFEQLNLIPTFIITPLTFLGGVFYSPHMLPEPWATVTRVNPILYMVEGLRYGLLGSAPSPPLLGLGIVSGIAVVTGVLVWWMLKSGYRLRS
jgi:ABC-2 type transport system permease protein